MTIPTLFPCLRLQLLGAFRVTLQGEEITNFDADSARALLAYLTLHTHHAHRRVALADLLWCDQPPESSLHNLRSALNRVRKALHDHDELAQPLILAERQSVQWNPQAPVWVDSLEFERLLLEVKQHPHRELRRCPWCIRRLTQLADLYQGEFLADVKVTSLAFEEWQQVERERLHSLAIQVFQLLGEYHLQSGAYAEAERYARQQIKWERWREEAHQQLIQALAASGQRSAALAQYEACRGILAAEFGVAPSPPLTALYEELRQQRRSQSRQALLTFAQEDQLLAARRQEFPNNLPLPQASLVDRQTELDALLQRLVNPANRLTTLVGPGGIGKSRLALTAAHALVRSFADGVWYVSLADLPSMTNSQQAQAAIVVQLCQVFELAVGTGGNLLRRLLDYLRSKELLLILDNFEHVMTGAPLLPLLWQGAPNVTLLVTSRQPLGFLTEALLRLPALTQPDAEQLFRERLCAGCPDFGGTAAQLRLIAEICGHLHGNPLAIELAAATARRQGLTAVALLVKQGIGNLTTTLGDLPERQRSLRALFHYSWQLLTRSEQQALLALARRPDAFTGPFDLSATADAPALLTALRDKSIVAQDAGERYYLPPLVRPFVTELALH